MLDSPPRPASLVILIRCLACGTLRIVRRTPTRGIDRPDCPLCGYVGWSEDETGQAADPS